MFGGTQTWQRKGIDYLNSHSHLAFLAELLPQERDGNVQPSNVHGFKGQFITSKASLQAIIYFRVRLKNLVWLIFRFLLITFSERLDFSDCGKKRASIRITIYLLVETLITMCTAVRTCNNSPLISFSLPSLSGM